MYKWMLRFEDCRERADDQTDREPLDFTVHTPNIDTAGQLGHGSSCRTQAITRFETETEILSAIERCYANCISTVMQASK